MIRFSSRGGFPVDPSTLHLSGYLFGGSVEPFSTSSAVLSSSPASTALRCSNCGGYWWPGCHWRGNSNWLCGLCGCENAIRDRMPHPDEMREFAMLYRDGGEDADSIQSGKAPKKSVVFFFLIDVECGEAFLDAAIIAAAAALLALPANAKCGVAVSGKDFLTVFEFNNSAEDFATVTSRIRDGLFRVELKETLNVANVTCKRDSFALLRAINSIKVRYSSSYQMTSPSAATTPRPSPLNNRSFRSCIGRSVESLVSFLAASPNVLGAQVFSFTESATRFSQEDQDAIKRATFVASGIAGGIVGGVGVDWFFVSSSAEEQQQIDVSLKRLVYGSGGTLFDHSYGELDQGGMSKNIKARCQRPFVFRGMVKARCCPELIVASSSPTTPTDRTGSIHTGQDTFGDKEGGWWIVSMLKNAALSILATLTQTKAGQGARSQYLKHFTDTNIFLGKGLTSPEEWLWSIPSADPDRFALAFEIDFVQPDGLQFIAYPRSMAVQIASTFVNESGLRFIRVETRSAESDRPVRLPSELWQTMDPKQLIFVLVRILLYSGQYSLVDYKNAVLDWTARAISSGCGAERFEKKLAGPLFGLLRLFASSSTRTERFRLLGEVNPSDLERLLWPSLTPAGSKTLKLPHKLSRKTLQQSLQTQQDLVLDAVSDVFVLLNQKEQALRNNEETPALVIGRGLVLKSPHDPRLFVLDTAAILNSDVRDFSSPASAKSSDALGRELLLEFMYEDPVSGPSDWPLGLQSFVSDMLKKEERTPL